MKSKRKRSFSLGDLIVVLFDESKKVSANRLQQNLLVYAALKDLLKGKRVHTLHPIALKA